MQVVVVDYGVGNLLSVSRAIEACGAEPRMAVAPDEIVGAERLILPGVGAFRDAMAELARRDFIAALRDYAVSGRPLLGICLGMQMLLDYSEEFGVSEGLGLIPGHVEAIPATDGAGKPHKFRMLAGRRCRRRKAPAWMPGATASCRKRLTGHPPISSIPSPRSRRMKRTGLPIQITTAAAFLRRSSAATSLAFSSIPNAVAGSASR